MSLTSRVRVPFAGALALALMLVATMLALSAAPADASIGRMTGSLRIVPGAKKHVFNVKVRGVVRMPQAEAQSLIDSGHRMLIRIWGSDPFIDDVELVWTAAPVATSRGLEYDSVRITSEGDLDEDIEGGDELYAGIRLTTATGKSLKAVQSNTWYGRFSRFAGYGGT